MSGLTGNARRMESASLSKVCARMRVAFVRIFRKMVLSDRSTILVAGWCFLRICRLLLYESIVIKDSRVTTMKILASLFQTFLDFFGLARKQTFLVCKQPVPKRQRISFFSLLIDSLSWSCRDGSMNFEFEASLEISAGIETEIFVRSLVRTSQR